MTPSAQKTAKKNWYRISVDTLRGFGVFAGLLVVAGLGFVGYRVLQQQFLEREVVVVIGEAQALLEELRGEAGVDAYREEYETALRSLQQAQSHATEQRLADALRDAEHSRGLLTTILNAMRYRGPTGEAQFLSVQGAVEYRRGERGEWRPARSRVALLDGDYVKTTGGSSAEVMFQDGTVVTVRPDTVILVDRSRSLLGGRGERAVALEYGWVNLSTSQNPGTVTTPTARAVVQGDSQAVVSYDQKDGVGRFAAYQGGLSVASGDGSTVQLGERQQVVQSGSELGRPSALPAEPKLIGPDEGAEVKLAAVQKLELSWNEVAGARSYALQVSRSTAFADNIIDVENRTKLKATLGLRAEGSYVWRVAATGREGMQGPWSEPRTFRVVGSGRPNQGS